MKEQLKALADRHAWDEVEAFDNSAHLRMGNIRYSLYDASLGAMPDCIWLARMTEPGWRMKVADFDRGEDIAWEFATNKTKARL